MERRACVGVAAHEFVAISRERNKDREMFWRAYAYIGMVRVCPERGRGRGSQLRVWILDETRTSSKLGRNEGLPRSRNRGRYRTDSRSSYFIPLYSFIFLYIPLYSFIFTFQPFFFDPFPFSFSRSRVPRVIAKDPKN